MLSIFPYVPKTNYSEGKNTEKHEFSISPATWITENPKLSLIYSHYYIHIPFRVATNKRVLTSLHLQSEQSKTQKTRSQDSNTVTFPAIQIPLHSLASSKLTKSTRRHC
jgi:hypothetical protein